MNEEFSGRGPGTGAQENRGWEHWEGFGRWERKRRVMGVFFFFFKYNFTFIDKTFITVAKFKTKRKHISILQIGSKLHKHEKE